MKYVKIQVNGVSVTCYEDGSIERPFRGRPKRTFGANTKGYRKVLIAGKKVSVHRIIAKAFLDDYDENLQTDHKNGIKDHNRPQNLRMVTPKQNSQAFTTKRRGTSSQYRGVSWENRRERWKAQIKVSGKSEHIGYFDCEYTAALAYDVSAIERGFAKEALNFQ